MARSTTYEKYENLVGTIVNKWKILEILKNNKHHVHVLAQCYCGNVKEVRLTYIVNNRIRDCGCGHKNRVQQAAIKQYEHLIGTTISGWTVLNLVPPDKERHFTYAVCECRCGTIKDVRLTYLVNGRSKDCGCGRKSTLHETRTKNLIGQKFGKLTVVEMLQERNQDGRIKYRCLCDCGNIIDVLGYSLTTHHTMSCGCLVSYWNMFIDQLLDDKGILHHSEYRVSIDGKNYRYDFYLPQYNLFIEYDGIQHYEPVRFRGNPTDEINQEFQRVQESDRVKNQYSHENHINLLRIPYWETKNIETIIDNYLQRLNEEGFADQTVKYVTV